MIKPILQIHSYPELENPVFIAGLTGFGSVGKISAELLIESSKAQLFAELYSPHLPDYATIDEEGIVHLPRYSFYFSKHLERDVIIMTGDAQPSSTSSKAHYQTCGLALDLAEEHKCRFVITMGGFLTSDTTKEVFIAATDPELVEKFATEKIGIYRNGSVIGATGLLLGLAKVRGMKGLSILGVTSGVTEDRKAASSVSRFIIQIIGNL
ncbi:MAG: PAC2 family protein [Candidatus Bathyarchaeia archaeon]